MSEIGDIYVGKKVVEFKTAPDLGEYTKVILNKSETEYFVSGTDGGLVLEATCPWATQEIADDVLASLNGYRYRPYEASDALLEPAAELGDAITASGVYSGIYSMAKRFGKLSVADIAAPHKTEVEHEFQFVTSEDRRFTRTMKRVSAELGMKMDSIYASVKDGDGHYFGWEQTVDGMRWYTDTGTVMQLSRTGLDVGGALVVRGKLTVYDDNIDKMSGNKIKSGTTVTSGTVSGGSYGSIKSSTITTSNTSGSINTLLGYADYANKVFDGTYTATYIKASHATLSDVTIDSKDVKWQSITINGSTYEFLIRAN